MNDAGYRRRLAADLPKWLDSGWVTAEGATKILSSAGGGRRTAFGLSTLLATIGALLLGLGVIAYIGANWEEMPRAFKLAMILLAMIVAYGAAFELDRRQHRVFAEAALLAAALVFAGAIALVGQMYHMAGDFEGALLLFEVGVMGAALFTGSPTLVVVGLVGAGYWAWLGTYQQDVVPHYLSLAAILIGIAVSTVQSSHYGRIVAILAFMFWAALTLLGFATLGHWSFAGGMAIITAAALAIWAVGAALASTREVPRLAALGDAVLWPGLFAILVAVGILQIAWQPGTDESVLVPNIVLIAIAIVATGVAVARKGLAIGDVVAVAVIAIAALLYARYMPDETLWQRLAGGAIAIVASVWAVALGQSGRHPIGKSIGLAAFGMEIIYLYIVTLGTYLDTAIAFLAGGALFVVLSWLLFRLDRRLEARAKSDPPAPPPPAPEPQKGPARDVPAVAEEAAP